MIALPICRRTGAILSTVFLTLLSSLVAQAPASAYSLSGCRFGSATISVTANNAIPSGYATPLSQARGDWSVKTDVTMPATPNPAAAIRVEFGNYGNLFSGRALDTTTCPGGIHYPATKYIEINTYILNGYTSAQRQSVIGHEIGHHLGLAHNTNTASCGVATLMSSRDTFRHGCGIYGAVSDDVAGVNSRY